MIVLLQVVAGLYTHLFACQVGAASDPVVCSLLLLFLSFFLPLSYLLLYFNSPV